jgi:beta-1,4-mannosyl-glycoprotein beta-1,4-N-acetylglucosaminyltransferase
MRIIDCFNYFDEDMMLELRLSTLFDYVDKFVICEATLDHAGNEKRLNFDMKKFKKYEKKINYIVVNDLPKVVKSFKKHWHPAHARDQFQRNALVRGLSDCDLDDIIMISDLDEIPNPEKISDFKKEDKYACFVQGNFLFKLNLLNTSEPKWFGTRVCRKKDLKSPQWLREIKSRKIPFYKFYKPKFDKFILNGGWHFSSVKTAEGIYKKLHSFSEQQFNNKKFKDMDIIKNKIEQKKDLFDRGYDFKVLKVDQTFPKFIYENQDKFKDFIYTDAN